MSEQTLVVSPESSNPITARRLSLPEDLVETHLKDEKLREDIHRDIENLLLFPPDAPESTTTRGGEEEKSDDADQKDSDKQDPDGIVLGDRIIDGVRSSEFEYLEYLTPSMCYLKGPAVGAADDQVQNPNESRAVRPGAEAVPYPMPGTAAGGYAASTVPRQTRNPRATVAPDANIEPDLPEAHLVHASLVTTISSESTKAKRAAWFRACIPTTTSSKLLCFGVAFLIAAVAVAAIVCSGGICSPDPGDPDLAEFEPLDHEQKMTEVPHSTALPITGTAPPPSPVQDLSGLNATPTSTITASEVPVVTISPTNNGVASTLPTENSTPSSVGAPDSDHLEAPTLQETVTTVTRDSTLAPVALDPTPAPTEEPTQSTSKPSDPPSTSPSRRPTPVPAPAPSTPRPSWRPTMSPSLAPVADPTGPPSRNPTTGPPTQAPSQNPTTGPPTPQPSPDPTTGQPTSPPSPRPSLQPSPGPSPQPSPEPTPVPSDPPSPPPTPQPSPNPTTGRPTLAPSRNPTTGRPTPQPSPNPTTGQPTSPPSPRPSPQPSPAPSPQPSPEPTPVPSEPPSPPPTPQPSPNPTTGRPTLAPSPNPTTGQPTPQPSPRPLPQPSPGPTPQGPTPSPTPSPTYPSPPRDFIATACQRIDAPGSTFNGHYFCSYNGFPFVATERMSTLSTVCPTVTEIPTPERCSCIVAAQVNLFDNTLSTCTSCQLAPNGGGAFYASFDCSNLLQGGCVGRDENQQCISNNT